MTGWSTGDTGATGNASNKHTVRSSGARQLRWSVKAQQLAQRSVRKHCARGPFGGLSGGKWQKQVKTAAGSIGEDGSKTLIDNDFCQSDPC